MLLITECKFNSFTRTTQMKKLGKLLCVILFVELVYAGIIIQSVKADIHPPATFVSERQVDSRPPHFLWSGFNEGSWILITLLIGYGVQSVTNHHKEKKQERADH